MNEFHNLLANVEFNEVAEDVINSKVALKWALQSGRWKCPVVAGQLKIYCAEVECSPDCPIYAKESGYLAYSVAQI